MDHPAMITKTRGKTGQKSGFSANSPHTDCLGFAAFLRLRNGDRRATTGRMRDDIEKHIENLKREIEDATGEKLRLGRSRDCGSEVEEMYLRKVLAFELAEKKLRP